MPLQFGALKRRPFAFYPPILNIEHNEWRVRETAGPEILVSNLKSDLEVWIPKRLIGEISTGAGELLAVALREELEYKAGTLHSCGRRVVEMPAAGSAFGGVPGLQSPKSRARELMTSLGIALLACVLLIWLARFGPRRVAPGLGLAAGDDYAAVVHRLGLAAEERVRPPYRALWYPQRSRTVILMDGRYIGALDANWRVAEHVELPGRGDTARILGALPRF
jgi:hypothetical protein